MPIIRNSPNSLKIGILCLPLQRNLTKEDCITELQTVKIEKEKLIASGASMDGISIRRTGIAKVLWRKLDVEIPKSEVIANR